MSGMSNLHAGTGQSEVVPPATPADVKATAVALLAAASGPGDVVYDDGVFLVPTAVASAATLPSGALVSTPTAPA